MASPFGAGTVLIFDQRKPLSWKRAWGNPLQRSTYSQSHQRSAVLADRKSPYLIFSSLPGKTMAIPRGAGIVYGPRKDFSI